MQCPFCQEEVGSEDELQLHCLVCTSAYAEPVGNPIAPRVDSVVVRFRWVKSRPCIEREVHLISSLAGSVTLHRKIEQGLYESGTVGVPTGQHICQLAIGGDVVPTEAFEVNEDSDLIFIILQEDDFSYSVFGDSDRRARIKTDDIGSHRRAPEPVDTHYRPQYPLDERRVFQRLAQSARHIAVRRAEDTGHGEITRDWNNVAENLEREAHQRAKVFGDTVEPVEVPEPAAVESGVGFGEAAEAGRAGATVAEGIGAEEMLSLLAVIFLL